MTSVKRVLVGIDFSDGADLAIRAAIRTAHQHGALLHAVHVIETLPLDGVLNPALNHREAITRELRDRLNRSVEKSGYKMDDDDLSTELRIGRPTDELLGAAEDIDADVIVVGFQGMGFFERTLLGSVASSLVRQSTRPVLVARERKDSAPARVLAAIELDSDCLAVIRAGADWAQKSGGELHVLYAWEIAGLADYHTALPTIPARNLDVEVMDESRVRLEALVVEALGEGHNATLHVRPGTAAYEIIFAAEQEQTTLVVLGSHGRRGIAKFLLGNTAERVVQRAPCSVLVLRV